MTKDYATKILKIDWKDLTDDQWKLLLRGFVRVILDRHDTRMRLIDQLRCVLNGFEEAEIEFKPANPEADSPTQEHEKSSDAGSSED
jgi:hypothetical protein